MIPAIILWSVFGIVLFVGIFSKNREAFDRPASMKKNLTMIALILISGPAIWLFYILAFVYDIIDKIISYGFKE